MLHFLENIAHGAAAFSVSLTASIGFVFQPSIMVITPPPQMEVLPASETVVAAPTSIEKVGELENTISAIVTPLTKNTIRSAIRIAPLSGRPLPAETAKTESVKPAAEPKPAAVFSPTARGILDNTSFTVNTRIDGTYWLALHTATGANEKLNWDLSGTGIGGSAGIPKFDVSFSCNPSPIIPSSDAADQNPVFDFNTKYGCTVTLTDSRQRKESKDFGFETGAGRIVIKNSALNTTLKSDKSTNGFVFDNQSGVPITVTGLVFDVSFVSLNTGVPVALRFTDPATEQSFGDHQLQDLPAEASNPRSHGTTGLSESVSFTVKPGTQRMLPVEILGDQPIIFGGVNPEVKVTVRQITTDHPEVKTLFVSPTILWTCIPFDPTKTSQTLPNEQNCR